MWLRAGSARPQRVSGSARTNSQRADSARNPIAFHVNFGDDSVLNALTRTYIVDGGLYTHDVSGTPNVDQRIQKGKPST